MISIVLRSPFFVLRSFRSAFEQLGGISLGADFQLQFVGSDQEAFHALVDGRAAAALVPRPYGLIAEGRNLHRIPDWPDLVDDPLPITIETTETLLRERAKDFAAFVAAHREGIRFAKANREKVVQLLVEKFAHDRVLAEITFDDYLSYMDESLLIDVRHLGKLLAQIAGNGSASARQIATDWAMVGAVKT